jgi:hypothetical protein
MASEKQIQANRRNAKRSTGPVTPEGKAAVSQNALKHGLRARQSPILPSQEELQPLRDRLTAEWHPQTEAERSLIEELAVVMHQQAHYEELEASWDSRMLDADSISALTIMSRRQAALTRRYHKASRSLALLRIPRPAEALAINFNEQSQISLRGAGAHN